MNTSRTIAFGDRTLTLLSLEELPSASLNPPFAAMLPAFDEGERHQAASAASSLLELGCAEFCTVGPEAELLHDSIDALTEEKELLQVVTTWHTDCSDAAEYVLYGAAACTRTLLALVASHPELVSVLQKEARDREG